MACNGRKRGPLAAGLLLTASALGCFPAIDSCPDALFELRNPSPHVRLPFDESPKCSGGAEWWYYTGRLVTADQDVYGFEVVVFHVPRAPYIGLVESWVAHVGLVDGQTGHFTHGESLLRGPAGPQPSAGFDVRTDAVRLRRTRAADELRARTADGAVKLELRAVDSRAEPVRHGGSGYVPYGPRGMAFYYSRPRMAVVGTLSQGGVTEAVSGTAWFDRQWGLYLNNPRQPWDWFSVRLDDGTDIMLYTFPNGPEPVVFGNVIDVAGRQRELGHGDFTIESTASWRSPHSGVRYETGWRIGIPSEGLALEVAAVTGDQEFDGRGTTLNRYWEGLAEVTGSRGADPISGHAFIEQANGGGPLVP